MLRLERVLGIRTSFGKFWKSNFLFPGPKKFDHWPMEKFWIFSRHPTLKETFLLSFKLQSIKMPVSSLQ